MVFLFIIFYSIFFAVFNVSLECGVLPTNLSSDHVQALVVFCIRKCSSFLVAVVVATRSGLKAFY